MKWTGIQIELNGTGMDACTFGIIRLKCAPNADKHKRLARKQSELVTKLNTYISMCVNVCSRVCSSYGVRAYAQTHTQFMNAQNSPQFYVHSFYFYLFILLFFFCVDFVCRAIPTIG